jgi:hypothetical protein
LVKFRLCSIFDRIVHIDTIKGIQIDCIDNAQSIYISASFENRKIVQKKIKIPVFALDNIPILLSLKF